MHKEISNLFGDCLDDPREIVIFPLPMFCPRCEITQFTIISVIGHPHLWANKEDLLVMNDYSAIIDDVLVDDGPDFGWVQRDEVSTVVLTFRGRIRSPTFHLTIESWQEPPRNEVRCPLGMHINMWDQKWSYTIRTFKEMI